MHCKFSNIFHFLYWLLPFKSKKLSYCSSAVWTAGLNSYKIWNCLCIVHIFFYLDSRSTPFFMRSLMLLLCLFAVKSRILRILYFIVNSLNGSDEDVFFSGSLLLWNISSRALLQAGHKVKLCPQSKNSSCLTYQFHNSWHWCLVWSVPWGWRPAVALPPLNFHVCAWKGRDICSPHTPGFFTHMHVKGQVGANIERCCQVHLRVYNQTWLQQKERLHRTLCRDTVQTYCFHRN